MHLRLFNSLLGQVVVFLALLALYAAHPVLGWVGLVGIGALALRRRHVTAQSSR